MISFCPDALRASFIVQNGQSIVLGTAVVLGVLGAVLYRWWSRRDR